jgi:hypothetical protein
MTDREMKREQDARVRRVENKSATSPSLEKIVNWPQQHPFMAHLTNVRVDALRKEVDTLKSEVDSLKKELKETRETSQRVFNLFNFLSKNMYPDIEYYSDEESDDGPLKVSDLESESEEQKSEESVIEEEEEEFPEPPKLVRQSNYPGFLPNREYPEVNLDELVSDMEGLSLNSEDGECGEANVPEFLKKMNPLKMEELMSDKAFVGKDGIDYWYY